MIFFRAFYETERILTNKLKTPLGRKGGREGKTETVSQSVTKSVNQSLSTCGCVSRNVFRFSLRFLWVF